MDNILLSFPSLLSFYLCIFLYLFIIFKDVYYLMCWRNCGQISMRMLQISERQILTVSTNFAVNFYLPLVFTVFSIPVSI